MSLLALLLGICSAVLLVAAVWVTGPMSMARSFIGAGLWLGFGLSAMFLIREVAFPGLAPPVVIGAALFTSLLSYGVLFRLSARD